MEKQAIHSEMVKAGKRTYFFDLLIGSNEKPYLSMRESVWNGPDQDRKNSKILVFQSDFDNVFKAMERIVEAAKAPKESTDS